MQTLKGVLFQTLEMVLNGDASPEMVEQVCYLSEQMIKDDKNSIEVEKARLFMEIERENRITQSAHLLENTIKKVSDYEGNI